MLNIYIFKFGSACIINDNKVCFKKHERKAKELIDLGIDFGLVVSGAVVMGQRKEGDYRNKSLLSDKEYNHYARIGQEALYDELNRIYGGRIDPILVKEGFDIDDYVKRIEQNNGNGRIACINFDNANDLKRLDPDNDVIGAIFACHMNADSYFILGKYDGLLDHDGNLVERVRCVDDTIYSYCNGKSYLGNGGMRTKVDAGKLCMMYGVDMMISNIDHSIEGIVEGKGTLFRM